MIIYTHKLIEEYVLEIISRIQTIKNRCIKLLSCNFASEAPENLSNTIINICDYLNIATKSIFNLINWNKEEDFEQSFGILKKTDYFIRYLGSNMRYVDGAQTYKLPWSFIKPIKEFIKDFLPDYEIMFRPQWKYNYTLLQNNLYYFYYDNLSIYQIYVPELKLEDVLINLNKQFYIISFPSIERNNILIHCLLGHEIGHLLTKKYFVENIKEELFLKSIPEKIASYIEERINSEFPKLQEAQPLFAIDIIQRITNYEIKRTADTWLRGFEEILSDIIGVLLFGPAVLFSALEIALQDLNGLDYLPFEDNNFYPPWRTRIRHIFNIIKEMDFYPFSETNFDPKIIKGVTNRLKLIEELVNQTNDTDKISKDLVINVAYKEINDNILKALEYFKKESTIKNSILVKTSDFCKHLSHLVEKLDYGIPPNAYEISINERTPATIPEIINAAWFHRLSWDENLFNDNGDFNKKICEKRSRANRLTLKAIEYSDIENEYFKKMGKPLKYEADEL